MAWLCILNMTLGKYPPWNHIQSWHLNVQQGSKNPCGHAFPRQFAAAGAKLWDRSGSLIKFKLWGCSRYTPCSSWQVLAVFWLASSWRRSQGDISQSTLGHTVVFRVCCYLSTWRQQMHHEAGNLRSLDHSIKIAVGLLVPNCGFTWFCDEHLHCSRTLRLKKFHKLFKVFACNLEISPFFPPSDDIIKGFGPSL